MVDGVESQTSYGGQTRRKNGRKLTFLSSVFGTMWQSISILCLALVFCEAQQCTGPFTFTFDQNDFTNVNDQFNELATFAFQLTVDENYGPGDSFLDPTLATAGALIYR